MSGNRPSLKCASECPATIRATLADFAGVEIDVTVSTSPPLVAGPYTQLLPLICPHGITYWTEPTSEQIARWAKDGIR